MIVQHCYNPRVRSRKAKILLHFGRKQTNNSTYYDIIRSYSAFLYNLQ